MRYFAFKIIAVTALLFSAGCAQIHTTAPGAVDNPAEVAAVLATMDRYMTAIANNDYATMKAIDMPNSMTWSTRPNAAGVEVVTPRPATYWTDRANDKGGTLQERYWKPTVLLRGGIAVLWAPYEFKVDGKTSHCGVDAFDFVKFEGAWRLANAMWTVEPTACEQLRPADGVLVRP